ncbi:caspase family protein [Labrys sp. La1]|uniref:caspase family protein n=1 Tax=Labrys sp. La1 TaxID=3404917 RepID=UPI003EBEBAD2
MKRCLALLLFLAVAFVPEVALAGRRVALLIGNSDYAKVARLANPGRDVGLLKETLQKAGFDAVDTVVDADRAGMIAALRRFQASASNADIAVVYFSGHGIEIGGENYLVPIDAHLISDRDVQDETLALSRVVEATDGAGQLKLVILDACRNNPFLAKMSRTRGTRSVGKGLARVEPEGDNVLVAYAAREGSVALDGNGINSPYAQALARYLTRPGLDIRLALGKVRDDVLSATDRQQTPFFNGSLGGDVITLAPATGGQVAMVPPAEPPPPVEPPPRKQTKFTPQVVPPSLFQNGGAASGAMLRMSDPRIWQVVKDVDMPEVIEEFRDRFRDSRDAGEAEERLKQLLGVSELDPLPPPAGERIPAPETECDRIGAAPLDPDTVMRRTRTASPKEIVAACEAALKQYPRERRFMHQLGDALADAGQNDKALAMNLRAGIAGSQGGWISSGRLFKARAGGASNPDGNSSISLTMAWQQPLGSFFFKRGFVEPFERMRGKAGVTRELSKAAASGDQAANVWIGYMYLFGFNVPKDYAKGMAALDKARLSRPEDTGIHLALMLKTGYGVRQDVKDALEEFGKAQKADNSYATYQLALMYLDGLGVPQNYAAAARMMGDAAVGGDPRSVDDILANFAKWPREYRVVLQQELLKRNLIEGKADGELAPGMTEDLRKLAPMPTAPMAATP